MADLQIHRGNIENGVEMLGQSSAVPALRKLRSRLVAFAATAAATSLSFAGTAQASLLGLGGGCPSAALSQPFTPWGDNNNYAIAPGGDFEGSLAGWSLSGGAQRRSGSESYGATGSVGSYSLLLPKGGEAWSPPICVTSAYPYFRFFAKAASGSSSVRVEVVYRGLLGLLTDVLTPGGGLATSSDWQPSPQLSTNSGLPTLLGSAELQLRFIGAAGTSQLDDVYVDPHGRG